MEICLRIKVYGVHNGGTQCRGYLGADNAFTSLLTSGVDTSDTSRLVIHFYYDETDLQLYPPRISCC